MAITSLPMLLPNSTAVLVQLLTIGLLDATYTAFKVPISFALPYSLHPYSVSCIIDELAGKPWLLLYGNCLRLSLKPAELLGGLFFFKYHKRIR